ncbi:MAG TPA: 50S ribosomal protein L25 [Desulfobacterales bacterium]|nr:50S ribosomal protein L25 [Desulfobacterales bacterium]
MEIFDLKASTRTPTGNGPARVLRGQGRVPAVLYGPKTEPINLSVDTKDLETVLKKGAAGQLLLNLIVENGATSTRPAMIKEVQRSPLSRAFLHVDFYEIDMHRKIVVPIPVTTTGKCKGVEDGGMLQIIRRELEVLCLPTQIPAVIEIDITGLGMGESIHVEDIPLSGDLEVPHDVNFTVVTVLSPKAAEGREAVEGEEEEAEAVAGEAAAGGEA